MEPLKLQPTLAQMRKYFRNSWNENKDAGKWKILSCCDLFSIRLSLSEEASHLISMHSFTSCLCHNKEWIIMSNLICTPLLGGNTNTNWIWQCCLIIGYWFFLMKHKWKLKSLACSWTVVNLKHMQRNTRTPQNLTGFWTKWMAYSCEMIHNRNLLYTKLR